MKEIPLANSIKFLQVDDEDYERLIKFTWYVGGRQKTQVTRFDGNQFTKLTAQIFGDLAMRDHKDRNPFNFQKSNLRLATRQQNSANSGIRKTKKSSKFRGVSWCERDKIFRAHIKVNSVSRSLGSFDEEWKAARAYNWAALKEFGEFAYLNKYESERQG